MPKHSLKSVCWWCLCAPHKTNTTMKLLYCDYHYHASTQLMAKKDTKSKAKHSTDLGAKKHTKQKTSFDVLHACTCASLFKFSFLVCAALQTVKCSFTLV